MGNTGNDSDMPTVGRVRNFVEACGRHPFATGVFALLGVFGLIFSFITFAIDQAQSSADDADKQTMKSSIKHVEVAVQAISAADEEPKNIDPIEAHAGDPVANSDNVAFPVAYEGKSKEWIQENVRNSFANLLYLQFSIKSAAKQDFVQIAPYLVVDVVKVDRVPPKLAAIYKGERGGASELRSFSASLVPKTGLQFAALTNDETGEVRKDIAYFTLSPREPEEFFLTIQYVPGYIFTYQVGLHYRYKGKDQIHWLTGRLRAGIPDYTLPVANGDDISFVENDHPDFTKGQDQALEASAARYAEAAASGRVFNSRQLPGGKEVKS